MSRPTADVLGSLNAGEMPTLTARAADALRRAIGERRLAEGQLYSVAQLARQFGVSRTPVREALLLLEREGMVRFERNRGVRILEASVHDLVEVFTLRLLLEVPGASCACSLISDAEIDKIEHELASMRAEADREDETDFMAHDKRFHDLILRASGNGRLADIVAQLRDQVRSRGASTVGRSRSLHDVLAEHVAILNALRNRDAARVERAMREHIENTARLLMKQEGAGEAWTTQGWDSPSR